MRKFLLVLTLGLFLISFTSAEIIINTQPKEIYNLGETITIPITVKSLTKYYGTIELDLICAGNSINFYKNGVSLSEGQEKRFDPSLILTKNIINDLKGKCFIKTIIGEDYKLTKEFTISDIINIKVSTDKQSLNPTESIIIEGNAEKLSGNTVDGFIQIDIYSKDQNTSEFSSTLETINNGFFYSNTTLDKDIPAGKYIANLWAYEKDALGEITNQGKSTLEFSVNQVATNLEILITNKDVSPGNPLKAKAILHDQTGINIPSQTEIKIKNSKDKLLDKFDVTTDEEFEFKTVYNQEPGTYLIIAKSQGIENQARFNIIEKKDIKIKIVNNTLFIQNTGNTPYCNKTILVKIGTQALNLNPCIDVDKEEKYKLSAPDGNYDVFVITDEQEYQQSAVLTGKTIDINEDTLKAFALTRHPLVWIFVVAILGFLTFTIYKKGFKRAFVGYIHKRRDKKNLSTTTMPVKIKQTKASSTTNIFDINKAELCLSIKGDKQNATIVTLKLKNYKELKRNPESVKETISKISDLFKIYKTAVYENEENIFIIFAPVRTKTFKNEMPAIKLAQNIKSILSYHNKLMKQKIDFGISINNGSIIAKEGMEKLQFMSLGDLMTQSKKIAACSTETILLGEKIKEKLGSNIKVKKFTQDKLSFYAIIEIKDRTESEKFIKSFLEKVEKK